MAMSPGAASGTAGDGCAELRLEVTARCDEAHAAAQAQAAASEETRARKRDAVAAQHQVEAAQAAADPAVRRADKAAAHDALQLARRAAASDEERVEATAAWAAAIDRINRQGRLAARSVTRARTHAASVEQILQAAQRTEQSLRFRAEAAQAACLDGRVRLAACDERLGDADARPATPFEPHAGTGGHALHLGATVGPEPLVIDAILAGDAQAIELAARAIAERAVLSPAQARLQLHELIDAVITVAGEDGYLDFDATYPLWSQLTPEESRDVVGALARLGFAPEPHEGWHAGRQPTGTDLSVALGYAGLDTRLMRTLPGAVDLAAMPASIGVDARAFLVALAPELAVGDLVRLLGLRAATLESLWDAWGQVRPILLTPRRQLEAADHSGPD